MRASEMIRARARQEPAFRNALHEECLRELRDGKPDVAEHMLREYLELPEEEVRSIMDSAAARAG